MLKTSSLLTSIRVAEATAEKFGNLELFKEFYLKNRTTKDVMCSIAVALEDQYLYDLFLDAMADCRKTGPN